MKSHFESSKMLLRECSSLWVVGGYGDGGYGDQSAEDAFVLDMRCKDLNVVVLIVNS